MGMNSVKYKAYIQTFIDECETNDEPTIIEVESQMITPENQNKVYKGNDFNNMNEYNIKDVLSNRQMYSQFFNIGNF